MRAANISDESYLATDYLNHFNEAVMLVQMVADMPEMLDEIRAWAPKSYCDHFRDSGFANRALAVDAYNNAPDRYRAALVMIADALNARIAAAITELGHFIAQGDDNRLRLACDDAVRDLGALIDQASGVIHGDYAPTSGQSDIDRLIAEG